VFPSATERKRAEIQRVSGALGRGRLCTTRMCEQNEVEDRVPVFVHMFAQRYRTKAQHTDVSVCAYLYKIVDESRSAIIRSLPEYEGDIG